MIIILISLFFIFGFGFITINSANAFTQVVQIHIDKGGFVIGNYQILLKNLDSGAPSIIKEYTDRPNSEQRLVSTWYIDALDGDKLQACLVKATTGEIVCDFKSASSDSSLSLDFNLNWADRITP